MFNVNCDYIAKVILIGDASTGKSSIINRYCGEKFKFGISETVGIDYKS